MLTNFATIKKSLDKLKEVEATLNDPARTSQMSKKEVLTLQRQQAKLDAAFHGIRDMRQVPDVIFVIDPHREDIAITEANKLGIPVVAIVDTNCDPEVIDFPIPGNDDAIRAIELITGLMSSAFVEGRQGVDGAVQPEEAVEEPAEVVETVETETIVVREKLHDAYSEVGEKVVNQELEDRKGWKEA